MPETLELIVVPHTHWDREWYQTFQQFRVRLVRAVDLLLQTLHSDPTFSHFMLDGQMIVLADYLEAQPQAAEDLQRYAREGRIQVGPWYIQPDEFLVGGEAIVRNLLLGKRMAASYGGAMPIGYVPDCFGHIAQMPQILRGFGIETATFWRGVGAEVRQSEFWWDAPDGSRVRVVYLCGEAGYSNARDLPLSLDPLVKRLERIVDQMRPYATASALLLMNGSDHLEPQQGLPAALAEANERLAERGMHARIGTLPEYVARVQHPEHELTVYQREWRSPELSHLLPDVLSSRMWIKQRNAANEELLTHWADPLAAWAWALGAPHPTGLLDIAWRLLLQNQPHDSICGCSIDQVHREMVPRYDQSEQIAEAVIQQSADFLAQQVDTSQLIATTAMAAGGTVPVVVLNPAAGPRTAVAEAQVQLAAAAEALVVSDETGQLVPHVATAMQGQELLRQTVAASEVDNLLGLVDAGRVMGYRILSAIFDAPDANGRERVWITVSDHGEPDLDFMEAAIERFGVEAARPDVQTFDLVVSESAWASVQFAARDVPAYGGRAFLVRARTAADPPAAPSDLHVSSPLDLAEGEEANGWGIENAHLRVDIDGATGELTVTDKATGTVYPHLHQFQDGGDVGDLYNYAPPAMDRLITAPAAPPTVVLHEANSVRATLRIKYRFALPVACAEDRQTRSATTAECAVVADVTLEAGAHHVAIRTTVNNLAQDHRLRVLFAAPFATATATADGTFMVNERPARHGIAEEVWRNWVETPANTQPQKRFVSVTDGTRGLAILNRGLPEYEAIPQEDGTTTLALTLLRCVGWLSRDDFSTRRGHAGPMLATPEGQMPGNWTFDYAILPHGGDWQAADALVAREAEAWNNPVRAVPTTLHHGAVAATWSMVQLGPAPLQVSTVKRAEDGSGVIARWYNPTEQEVIADLVTVVPFQAAAVVMLDEGVLRAVAGEQDAPQQHWRIPTPGGGIVTVRLVPHHSTH